MGNSLLYKWEVGDLEILRHLYTSETDTHTQDNNHGLGNMLNPCNSSLDSTGSLTDITL